MPCHDVLCRAMPCHAVSCRAVPCRVVQLRAVQCRAVAGYPKGLATLYQEDAGISKLHCEPGSSWSYVVDKSRNET